MLRRSVSSGLVACSMIWGLVACGSDDDDGNGGAGEKSNGGDNGAGASDGAGGQGTSTGGSSSGGAAASGGDGSGGMASLANEFETCAVEAKEAETLPADIVFLIDQSQSMIDRHVPPDDPDGPTRWDVLREAVLSFIDSDSSRDLRMGLSFFPVPGDEEGGSCSVADYATPQIGVTALSDGAALLSNAYPETPGGGLTPSLPALQGALQYARSWGERPENLERGVAVVWVTDGYQTICDGNVSDLSALAGAYNNPEDGELRVPTFVVGLGVVPNLKEVARLGGTGDGFFVADHDDAVKSLEDALRRVANSPSLCEFDFPVAADGSALDPEKVNVQFTPQGSAGSEVVYQTDGAASCAKEPGWYYDDPENPTKIEVCPSLCGNFGGGSVSIVVGCKSISIF